MASSKLISLNVVFVSSFELHVSSSLVTSQAFLKMKLCILSATDRHIALSLKESIIIFHVPNIQTIQKSKEKAPISRSLKILVGRLTRFERASDGATIRCVNQLHHNRHVCLTLK